VNELQELKPAKTWVYELLKDFGCTEPVAMDILQSLDSSPGRLFVFDRYILLKDRDELVIREREDLTVKPDLPKIIEYQIHGDESQIDLPLKMSITRHPVEDYMISKDPLVAGLDLDKLRFPLVIRKWKKGDHFYPIGMGSKKKLSDFFVDEKFTRFEKESAWLLCSGDKIAWILGKRLDDRFKITSDTRTVYQIRLEACSL
jgi:tRNA(Ile)-lysidine synthase